MGNVDDFNSGDGSDLEREHERDGSPRQAPVIVNKSDKRRNRRKDVEVRKQHMTGVIEQETTGNASPISNAYPADTVLRDTEQAAKLPRHGDYNKSHKGVVNIWVPIMPHYELRPIRPGGQSVTSDFSKTRKEEHGVFATQAIARGSRIISEPPLIKLPAPGDQLEGLMRAYQQLHQHEKARIWSLKPSPISVSPLLESLASVIDPVLLRITEILRKDKAKRSQEESRELAGTGPQLEHSLAILRLAARWHAGRHSLIDLPETQRENVSEGTPITGLFVETAGLRHSCVPNCYAHYNAESDRMTVHTTKPIGSGEELTLSSLATAYYLNASSRAEKLKEDLGIECKFEACDTSHAKFNIHEEARIRAHARAVELSHFLTSLDIMDSDDVMESLSLAPDTWPQEQVSKEDLEEAESLALFLIKDLIATGAHGVELVRWYNALIDRVQPRLMAFPGAKQRLLWGIVLAHATKCEKLGKWCLGEDSKQYEELRKRRKGIAKLAEKLERMPEP
jgi:hypothetical protein